MRMVKRFAHERWGRACLAALAAVLCSVVLVGVSLDAQAQDPVMVVKGTKLGDKPGAGPLSKATFNHGNHEKYVKECETCHHASQDACSTCHTTAGSAEGGYVQLSRAMHDSKSKMACVGCHQKETAKASCAGCHRSIPAGPRQASCAVCHKDPKAPAPAAVRLDVPDTVEIGSIAKKYLPVSFNHANHVDMLMDAAKGPLAKAFHAKPGVFCQGCHHNTPADMAPPKCGTCHAQSFQDENPKRPGLEGGFPHPVQPVPQGHGRGLAQGHGLRGLPRAQEITRYL